MCSELSFTDAFSIRLWRNPRILRAGYPGGREVRYSSGKTVYVERLEGDRWLGCGWNVDTSWHTDFPDGLAGPADGQADVGKMCASEAFELRMKDRPS